MNADILTHCKVQSFGNTQVQYVYDLLKGRGSRGLTNEEAVSIFGIGSLSRRITDLDRAGVHIRKQRSLSGPIRYFIATDRLLPVNLAEETARHGTRHNPRSTDRPR
jgi:hypothetical protein